MKKVLFILYCTINNTKVCAVYNYFSIINEEKRNNRLID